MINIYILHILIDVLSKLRIILVYDRFYFILQCNNRINAFLFGTDLLCYGLGFPL